MLGSVTSYNTQFVLQSMARSIFIHFFCLYIILRCFGMFPYCIHKSKLRIRFIQRRRDIVLNVILSIFYLCYFSCLMPQCIKNKDFLKMGEKLYIYLNIFVLYLNIYKFLNLFIKVYESLQYFDIKMRCPHLRNRLFLIYSGLKMLVVVVYVCQDIVYYTRGEDDDVPLRCVIYLYVHDLMQTYQEALYIFAISLIRDHVVILEGKIKKVDNIDFQDIKVLTELKNNFQLMNTYFSTTLLIKLTSTFISFLLSANLILNSKNEGNLSIFEIFFSGGWFIVLTFDIFLLFYCIDRCLVAVSITKI